MATKADTEIGRWFRERRHANRMTQGGVGALLGVSRVTVSTIESGKRRLGVAELSLLMQVQFVDEVSACDLLLFRVPAAMGRGAREVLGD